MLEIVRSNRLEALVEALARRLAVHPLSDPMAPELVAVPSRGMERWLAQRLSQRLGVAHGNGGVCAHVEFPFPAKVVRRLLDEALEDGETATHHADPIDDEHDPWEPDALTWAILSVLSRELDDPVYSPLARYLGRDAATLRRGIDPRAYTLARTIARVFDGYDLHRPELVRAFVDDAPPPALRNFGLADDERWQAPLWRAVAQSLGQASFASRLREGVSALARAHRGFSLERISVFGVGALPAAQLAALDAVSAHVAVTIYLLAPSHAYWADIRSRREQLRSPELASHASLSPQQLDAVLAGGEGHPLLTSLGVVARDFQVVLERSVESYADDDVYIDPVQAPTHGSAVTMLAQLQSDILHLRNRGAAREVDTHGLASHPPALPIAADDDSIEIHGAHGDTRQVEVLRDRLLARFEADPTLEARDVLIMSPDVDRFAPLVSAVFAQGQARSERMSDGGGRDDLWGPQGEPQLPVHVADLSLAATNPIAAALLRLIALAPSRLPASEVLEFLALDVVRQRFGIESAELEEVRRWVDEAGARWGIDAAHRAEFGVPAQHTYTWRFAMERLALGVCMHADSSPFADVEAFDDMEGSSVDLLGRVGAFTRTLFELCKEMTRPRALDDWGATLYEAVDAMFATAESERWWSLDVRRELDAMLDDAGSFEVPVQLAVVEARLTDRLSRGRGAIGHQTGAITLCAMAPMRSVPHRVVCLLGMSDGVFPREQRGIDFDLVQRKPRFGDPNPRNEDRFLLLEATLAAREALIITYEGRDLRSNEARAPAVPIGELIDQLDRAFVAPDGGSVRDRVVVEHPLSPFDPRYFLAAKQTQLDLRRFDRSALAVARASLGRRSERWAPPPSYRAPARRVATAPEVIDIDIDTLARELSDCAGTYLRRAMGAQLPREDEGVEDREALKVQGLEAWKLRARLLEDRWQAASPATNPAANPAASAAGEFATKLARQGRLPPGPPGMAALRSQAVIVDKTWSQIAAQVSAGPVTELECRLDLSEVRLVGRVRVAATGALIHAEAEKPDGKRYLAAWLRFLLWQSQHQRPGTAVSAFHEEAIAFSGLTSLDAREELEAAVALWLDARTRPLPFLPKTGWALSDPDSVDPDEATSVPKKAAGEFISTSEYSRGEGERPKFRLVWGEVPSLQHFVDATECRELSARVFDPLRACLVDPAGLAAHSKGGARR